MGQKSNERFYLTVELYAYCNNSVELFRYFHECYIINEEYKIVIRAMIVGKFYSVSLT